MNMEIVKKECPYCNEIVEGNVRYYANHIRWCKCNPKYEEIRKGTVEKLSGNKVPRNEYRLKCEICGREYCLKLTEYKFKKGDYRKTCSDECAKKLSVKNTDSESKNSKISETMCKKRNINYIKTCKYCGKQFYAKKEKAKYCCKDCAINAKRDCDLKNRDARHVYRLMSKFQFSLNDYPNEFDFSIIKENGWYEASNRGNNINGVSRDHMFSVNEGFKQKIDPYFISHPANCKLLKQKDNFKKLDNCSITKEELILRVKKWNEKYGEYENKINYEYIEDFREN